MAAPHTTLLVLLVAIIAIAGFTEARFVFFEIVLKLIFAYNSNVYLSSVSKRAPWADKKISPQEKDAYA